MRRLLGLTSVCWLAAFSGITSSSVQVDMPLTSTWLGGAVIGGLCGFLLLGGCPACAGKRVLLKRHQSEDKTRDLARTRLQLSSPKRLHFLAGSESYLGGCSIRG